MRFLPVFSATAALALTGAPVLARDALDPAVSLPPPAPPAITVSKAGDAIGAPIDIVAATRARKAAEEAAKDKTGGEATGSAIALSGMAPWGSPVSAQRVSSRFGLRGDPLGGGRRMHSGTDLVAPMGSPIYATSDGVVAAAQWNGGYGLFVALDHGGATQTRYGHLSRIAVTPGQRVRRGQLIGYVGSTGRSTGPHLHYEVRRGGVATDPAAAGLYAAPRPSATRTRRR